MHCQFYNFQSAIIVQGLECFFHCFHKDKLLCWSKELFALAQGHPEAKCSEFDKFLSSEPQLFMPFIQGFPHAPVFLEDLKGPGYVFLGPVDSHVFDQRPVMNFGVRIPF